IRVHQCNLWQKNMETYDSIYQKLYQIYNQHRWRYKENARDSGQMCLMWSTHDLPDDIVETAPFDDIESAFGIRIGEDDALELYDMTVREAAQKIAEMQKNKSVKSVAKIISVSSVAKLKSVLICG
ncbi:MAG TPA: hypothetical protein VIJ25_20340, partial [Methylococcales bacterium]